MKSHLRIKRLKIKGISKDYDYSFNSGLNIIAGPMSTGKTSVLEFIDYCLGSQNHPRHIEIRKKAIAVFLEIEIGHQKITIFRNLFSDITKATIHECSIDEIGSMHTSHEVQIFQNPEKESISSYILKKMGLFGISLQESPTQISSGKDSLSIRDLMWFCFLPNKRLDNDNLLFEDSHFMKRIKLQQVFDVIFEVHSGAQVNLAYQIKTLEHDISQLNNEIYTLQKFLKENKLPTQDFIDKKVLELEKIGSDAQNKFEEINSRLRGESDISKKLRDRIEQIEIKIGELSSLKRDRETLLERLSPLQGQYSEDIRKLHFLKEAKTILNPIGLVKCPYCLNEIDEVDNHEKCVLCGKNITIQPSESFNIDNEIVTIERKLKDLKKYVKEIDSELNVHLEELKENTSELKTLKEKLDNAIKEFISPYISERDEFFKEINTVDAEIHNLLQLTSFHDNVRLKIENKVRLEESLNEKELEIASNKVNSDEREKIISAVSDQYGKLLKEFHYPKLEKPFIDKNLNPYARYSLYREIGTSGGKTLISLSWFLSIFESAINIDKSHPGFVMIDTPQKNLGTNVRVGDELFGDTKIVEGFYQHVIDFASTNNDEIQIIIADNTPPEIAKKFIQIQFTGDPNIPPYGLIDDEFG